ncbi:LamG domain-containing protein [Candidatus Woesearchaeota archaeon]|nr:LamG domain-containing protein [Candidatus Woesearchaeota archaeon]
MIFDLGVNPNASEIGFGYDIPHLSYYPSGLVFGWDGSNNVSYLNNSIQFASVGGVQAGTINMNGTGIHVIDTSATWFNGSQYLVYNSSNYRSGDQAGMISYWFKSSVGSGSEYHVTFGDTDTGNNIYLLLLGINNGKFNFYWNNGIAGWRQVVVGSDGQYSDNEWHNFVFGSDGAQYLLYIDGINQSFTMSLGSNDGSWLGDINNRDNFVLGAYQYTGPDYSVGALDEVAIWDRALTSTEVYEIYNRSIEGNLKLQTRVGNSWNASNISGISRLAADNEINWSAWSSYYIPNGSSNSIQNLTESYRYLQYMALFETLNTNLTPVLMDVVLKQEDYQVKILNTQPFANFSLTYPTNVTWTGSNHTRMNWTNQSDLDGDILHPVLNIYNNSGSLILNSTLYNTSSIFGNSPSTAYYPEV